MLWLKRLDGPTPPVRPLRRPKLVSQKDKIFIPRVVAVPVGSKVDFRNDDPYYHNVFSLSDTREVRHRPVRRRAVPTARPSTSPGPVELLCNIHASMVGYVVVVDTPYYTQPRANGSFVLRNVPPGRYELSTWHEASARTIKQQVQVKDAGAPGRDGQDPQRPGAAGGGPGQVRQAPTAATRLLSSARARAGPESRARRGSRP